MIEPKNFFFKFQISLVLCGFTSLCLALPTMMDSGVETTHGVKSESMTMTKDKHPMKTGMMTPMRSEGNHHPKTKGMKTKEHLVKDEKTMKTGMMSRRDAPLPPLPVVVHYLTKLEDQEQIGQMGVKAVQENGKYFSPLIKCVYILVFLDICNR